MAVVLRLAAKARSRELGEARTAPATSRPRVIYDRQVRRRTGPRVARFDFLLGPDATEYLTAAGDDWVMPPDDHVNWLTERLRAAHDRVRRWGPVLA